jgi:hypothetical protein
MTTRVIDADEIARVRMMTSRGGGCAPPALKHESGLKRTIPAGIAPSYRE